MSALLLTASIQALLRQVAVVRSRSGTLGVARMNRLYAVTMAERGVSQLVSVGLEGAVKLRDAG
jgi:hypothetical protein